MAVYTLTAPFGRSDITIETGRMAKQAAGAVVVTMGETVVLVTVCGKKAEHAAGEDFLPLTCEYVEKAYAAGKFPGGYFKREGRPAVGEILKARLMDRPIRPLFPKEWHDEVQVIATVLSYDKANDPAICAMVGASAATAISDIPFDGPCAGCAVALIDGEYVVNPTFDEIPKAKLYLVVASTADAIAMVEGEAKEASEDEMIEAIVTAHKAMQPIVALQNQLVKKAGKAKQPIERKAIDKDLYYKVIDLSVDAMADAVNVKTKQARYKAVEAVKDSVKAQLIEQDASLAERQSEISAYLEEVQRSIVRTQIIEEGVRIDGRRLDEVRKITCEVGVLPRVHGSALFTRGETQSLATVTLGSKRDEQHIDDLTGDIYVPFMLHYNFPPFSVGEVKRIGSTGRRELGHGNLATRGVEPILPSKAHFKYTMRIVSAPLESNGSSSMATVCAASLALMNAGVPVKSDVAGIAMGLIQEGDKIAILSDILGDEDHLGDMDFKVVGTVKGINALQMDIKIKGLSRKILEDALAQAHRGRMHILGEMRKAIRKPAAELSPYAPRIITTHINPDKIRDLIGPGGKMIRGITEQTGCAIDVEDSGKVTISSPDNAAAKRAMDIINGLTQEAQVGRIYYGTVRKIMDFGAFVEILPGTDGLVPISELDEDHVERVEDVVSEGDEIKVKCINIDRQGKIRLSRKQALLEEDDDLDD